MTGKMHSGKIKHSERHQRILRVLKVADHPLSGEEISERVRAEIGKIPQAVSTTIGEMRSDENRADGYVISFACVWRSAREGEQPGPRAGKDGGIIFALACADKTWHDGRPRYWLQGAPGWAPRWHISPQGDVIRSGPRIDSLSSPQSSSLSPPVKKTICAAPGCTAEIDHGYTCSDACNAAWRESLRPKLSESAQESLL